MNRGTVSIIAFIAACLFSLMVFADSFRVIFHIGENRFAVPTDSIAYLTVNETDSFITILGDSNLLAFGYIDSVTIENVQNDTLCINYKGDEAIIWNTRADVFNVATNDSNADVSVKINGKLRNPVLLIAGESTDGRLKVDSDVDYTIVLNGIDLSSSHGPAFNSITKQKVTVKMSDRTNNIFSDSKKYVFADMLETASGCFNSMGAMAFKGNGVLNVSGNCKHAIYCKKSITFNDGLISVPCAKSDAIHSGKSITVEGGNITLGGMSGDGMDMDDEFTMNGGSVVLDITGEAAKGIKCGGLMTINAGSINATASGALKNKDGELSYCTILKCDSDLCINGGNLHLVNDSPGGKCISADNNLTIDGGTLYMETNGDGAGYTNASGETDYYTSKCIASDDTLIVRHGDIKCISTGIGGKGIVSNDVIFFGQKNQVDNNDLKIEIETFGQSVVNDTINDVRYGCPKAIKSSYSIYVYLGKFTITTHGMGGEGIEARGMKMKGGEIRCETFDDGINLEQSFDMYGGKLYCNSIDNDGIDSNGQIKIKGGEVFSVSQHVKNESFDSEGYSLYITGGKIFGISRQYVDLGSSTQPIYLDNWLSHFPVKRGKEYSVIDSENNILYSFVSPYDDDYCRMIISLPEFEDGCTYHLIDNNGTIIYDIKPQIINNYE